MNSIALSPFVSLVSGSPVASSLAVAEHFEKRHADILRAINTTVSDLPAEFSERNFALSSMEYSIPNGGTREVPSYNLSRDGFTLLAMGFTGKRALAWKVRYIEAFNAMEAQLRGIFTHPDADPREQPSFALKPYFGEGVVCPPTMFLDFCGCVLRVVDLDGARWWAMRDVAGACGVTVPCGVKRLKMQPEHIRRVSLRSAWGNRAAQGLVIVAWEPAMVDFVKRSGKRNVAQLLRFAQFAALPHPSTCPALPQQ